MRLWTLHPRHLDPVGLVALWREALLAQAVLHGKTRGYRHHPQLERFRAAPDPVSAICAYLRAVQEEAAGRGYNFNPSLVLGSPCEVPLPETLGQLEYEWQHLGAKLQARNPAWRTAHFEGRDPSPHPLFTLIEGPVQPWEKRGD